MGPDTVVGGLVVCLDETGGLRGPGVPAEDSVVARVGLEEVGIWSFIIKSWDEEDVAAHVGLEL